MRRQINNPYKLNLKLYVYLLIISIILMLCGLYLENINVKIISEIIKNLGFGCVASAVVAFIIEIGNINEKNKKFNELYESTYGELKFKILRYLELWAEFCCVVEESKNYKKEQKKWKEWYDLSKVIYFSSDDKNKKNLQNFLIDSLLKFTLDEIINLIKGIMLQKSLLEINEIYNKEIDSIIKDFYFELMCAKKELNVKKKYGKILELF